ncbi:helicase HerA domain-containing protein [Parvularcula sp. LCG005]|uniref:helicase HerA domain-containing protein n=1 Tax=Parvularcula sp. LCG005 TaxID=3078805 RepID=UPI002941D5C8|nr:DUF87 domain-containing protein [Parvularcula sp. LCG005]WOI51967.1 DUF87 domain-containing protein [Parvularcula sp. LCG005]
MTRENAKRIFIAGRTGSGKSTLARSMFRGAGARVIVCDPKGDWQHERGFKAIVTAPGWPLALLRTLRTHWQKGFKIALVPPPDGGSPAQDLIETCKLLFKVQKPYHERQDDRQITLVMEEMSFSYRQGVVSPEAYAPVQSMIRMGRDWGVNMIGITQSPGTVNRDYRANCAEVYLFALGISDAKSVTDVKALIKDPALKSAYDTMPNYHYIRITDHSCDMLKTKK